MTIKIKNICCIGAGYVGGPTMAVIAKHCKDIQVNVVDINKKRINDWNSNNLDKLPIYEPGLAEIIIKTRGNNLHFSNLVEENIASADMIFISVNTPTKKSGFGAGKASDLKWIDLCAREISKYACGHTIVVEKSTLPIKTADTIKQILGSSKKTPAGELKTFSVLSNPEFLSEGTAINDLENPDRILIGGEEKESIDTLISIYKNWVPEEKILTTNIWSSELSKLISNAFLAQRISSINSISALCEKTGANIKEVSLAIGGDKRIGKKFLNTGPGFGGSCFKKDILNLIYICNHYGLPEVSNYWSKVIDINQWQTKRISRLVVEKLFGTLTSKRIGILGFSYKANTNDTRESPAINICKDLLEEGAILQIYDPKVSFEQVEYELKNCVELDGKKNISKFNWIYSETMEKASEGCDALIILTEWDEFSKIDWGLISDKMRSPAWIFDTRLISNSKEATNYGLNVWNVGIGD